MTRSHTRNSGGQRRGNNGDRGADSYDVVQLYDVTGAHSDAAVARRRADFPLLRCAVDVNVPPECIRILRFESTQPENARDNRIATRRVGHDNFSRPPPVFEDCARWRIVTDFFRDLQLAQWGKPAASPVSQTELGGGDWINGHDIATVQKRQFLLARADHDLMPCVGRCARCDKSSNQDRYPLVGTDRRAVRFISSFRCARWPRPTFVDSHVRLNLKNFSAVSVVVSAISFNGTCRAAAIVSATMRVCAGAERFPRNGTGARDGQSVSTMNFQSGTCAATSRTAAPFLKVTIPVNETRWSRARTAFA